MKARSLPPIVDPRRPSHGDLRIREDFLRGFVAAGLLAAVQDRRIPLAADRRTMRCALQGGTSLAAGCAAARAWQRGNTGRALAAAAVGAVGVVVIEQLLQEKTSKESPDGQEEA